MTAVEKYPVSVIEKYFCAPPPLSVEEIPDYKPMFKALSDRLKPQDEVEWLLLSDYLHYCLQIRRWRKAAAALIEMMRTDALRALLESVIGVEVPDRDRVIGDHIENWFKGSRHNHGVLAALDKCGLGERHITTQAMAVRLPELDKIERMIGDFERRRSATLREFEYYRGAAFWRASKDLPAIIDGASDSVPASDAEEGA